MDCGVQSAMLSVPPVSEPSAPPQPQQLPPNTVFAPPDTDQAQFEADKRAVYKLVKHNRNDFSCINMFVVLQTPFISIVSVIV